MLRGQHSAEPQWNHHNSKHHQKILKIEYFFCFKNQILVRRLCIRKDQLESRTLSIIEDWQTLIDQNELCQADILVWAFYSSDNIAELAAWEFFATPEQQLLHGLAKQYKSIISHTSPREETTVPAPFYLWPFCFLFYCIQLSINLINTEELLSCCFTSLFFFESSFGLDCCCLPMLIQLKE